MGFLDSVSSFASKSLVTAERGGKQVIISRQLSEMKHQQGKLYRQLGEDLYETVRNNPMLRGSHEDVVGQLERLAKRIDEAQEQLDKLAAEAAAANSVKEKESAGNSEPRLCPNCGTRVARRSKFCIKCGAELPTDDEPKLDKVEPAEEEQVKIQESVEEFAADATSVKVNPAEGKKAENREEAKALEAGELSGEDKPEAEKVDKEEVPEAEEPAEGKQVETEEPETEEDEKSEAEEPEDKSVAQPPARAFTLPKIFTTDQDHESTEGEVAEEKPAEEEHAEEGEETLDPEEAARQRELEEQRRLEELRNLPVPDKFTSVQIDVDPQKVVMDSKAAGEIVVKYCTVCGLINPPTARFCIRCGSRL